jgi:uncharacterized protein (TIGR02246 family)
MAKDATAQELIDRETQYWQAIKRKDAEAARRLTDDRCIVAGAQGVGHIERDALADMMTRAPYTLDEFDIDNVEVRLLRNDVAIVAYEVHERLTVDGRSVSLEAADSSTWIRRDGEWRCALHTESIVGDPFGRDRRQTPR